MQLPDQNPYQKIFALQKEKSEHLRSETYRQRKERVLKIQQWIHNNRKSIQEVLYLDFQKPAPEVDISEILPCLMEIKFIAKNIKKWMRPRNAPFSITHIEASCKIYYEPKGVCLIISPWNYPFNLSISPLVSALSSGNTVILKPSEHTPHTSKLLTTMIQELFTPEEVTVIQGDASVAEQLLQLPFDHIFFTGSPTIGKIIMKAASQHLTSVTLELGGKSPTIIDETADISDATDKIAWGKFLNSGQTCIAPDYILIHKNIKEKFISSLIKKIETMWDKEKTNFTSPSDMTRIVNQKQFLRLVALLKNVQQHNATFLYGNEYYPEKRIIKPTIIEGMPPNSLIAEEEIFGPILPIVVYNNLQEAIHIINAKPKPLSIYMFSKNQKAIDHLRINTSSGAFVVNECLVHFSHHQMPFGGINNSGIGKSHGFFGFLAFSNEKSYMKQRIGFTTFKLLYPPYTAWTQKIINTLIKIFG
ncbi:MAG: aldehyde dehydrogenase family protein [Chitinophagaceae bacterium]|nr:aldehyde dehydrogenase family protein [Chitinophagaceae bacterium]